MDREIKAKGYEYDYDRLTYELVWSDEFDYEGEPDAAKWNYDVDGDGGGNNEYQYYTDRKNCWAEDGHLVIEARKEEYEGKQYTSARLVTRGKGDWLYGKFEARIKLPYGRGNWPAFWMLSSDWEYGGWPESGEIDIMEHVGNNVNALHASVHTESYYHCINTQKTATKYVEGMCDEYHTYTAEWLPDKIIAYVDGVKYFEFKPTDYCENPTCREWPFDKKFHLILNLAVGGGWGAAEGFDDTAFPQRMLVDYVRVYQSKEINELIQK